MGDRWRAALACWAAPLLVAAGCAADAEGPAPAVAAAVDVSVAGDPQRTSYPFTIDNCGVPVTFERPPERVLILNGTSVAEVESMLALGLGDRVIANAQSYGVSDEPGMTEKIKALPTGGLTQNDQFDVPAEQTLAAGADLVLSTWPGGFSAENGFAIREQLAAVGAKTLVNPVNCAMGRPEASEEEKAAYAAASPRSSLEFLVLLGQVFDVQERAYAVARELGDRIAAINAAVAFWLLLQARNLNALAAGDDDAVALGVDLWRFRITLLLVSSLLTATTVSVAGAVGFVGLMVPHAVRMVVGADHRRLLPVSLLTGAVFLVLVDLATRVVDRPNEYPITVFTAALGAPFFLWLLRREAR